MNSVKLSPLMRFANYTNMARNVDKELEDGTIVTEREPYYH